MAEIKVGCASECIYCGDKEGRSKEHIIATSFGGDYVIENASCSACSNTTSLIERGVSRRTFHIARSYYGLPTRRPKDYPKTVEIDVLMGKYGPIKKVDVPITEAPITVIFPQYPTNFDKDDQGRIWSVVQLRAFEIDRENRDRKIRQLLRRHNGHNIRWRSLPFKVDRNFERTLWKIAYGFFWLADRASLEASQARDFVFGDAKMYRSTEEGLLFQDIFSEANSDPAHTATNAAVYSAEAENHSHLYCKFNFFGILGLPSYCCRIPNISNQPFQRLEFSNIPKA